MLHNGSQLDLFPGGQINIVGWRTLLRLWRGRSIGVLIGRDSGQQTRLVFCIGRFESILVDQQKHS